MVLSDSMRSPLPPEIKLVQALSLRFSEFQSVAWSPDGQRLAAGASDGCIWVWDLGSDHAQVIEGHQGAVNTVAWSPDGRLLASGASDSMVGLWYSDGTCVDLFDGHRGSVNSVAWSPNGHLLASGSSDHTVRLWDKNLRSHDTLHDHQNTVNSVAWSPDGDLLASGSSDHTVRLWTLRGAPVRVLAEHRHKVTCVAWSPDGRFLASGSFDGTVRLWSLDGMIVRILKAKRTLSRSIAWSPDGRTLASASTGSAVFVMDLSGSIIHTLTAHLSRVDSLAWSADGRFLATASYDSTVRLWDSTGTSVRTLHGNEGSVQTLSWSPAGGLASGSSDKMVRLWNDDGSVRQILVGHRSRITAVAWSPNGEILASGARDRTLRLWDREGTPRKILPWNEDRVWSLAWSSDGRRLASGWSDSKVRVFDLEIEDFSNFPTEKSNVPSVAWSPNGYLACAAENTIRLWSPDGSPFQVLRGHKSQIICLAWSPTGRLLASGGMDATVRVWDLEVGSSHTLEGHVCPVSTVTWSPDGRLLASQDRDGEVVLWDPVANSVLARKPSRAFRWAGCGVLFVPVVLCESFGNSLALHAVDLSDAGIATRQYRSAKIVLLGESEVGKSTLALRLAEDRYEAQSTTHGMKVWTLTSQALYPPDGPPIGEEREVFLWDLGGQPEYQLIHQLFLQDTRLALFLMDPTRNKDNFTEIADWNIRLEAQLQRRGGQASKLLLHSKCDQPQTRPADSARLQALMTACGFADFLRVSAAHPEDGDTIAKLREILSLFIGWEEVPPVTTLKATRDVYDAVMIGRKRGDIFLTVNGLRAQFPAVEQRDFEHAVRLLSEQGLVVEIDDLGGERVLLLRVEEIERYAGAIILAVHANPRGVPAVEENAVFTASALPGIQLAFPLHERQLLISSVIQLLIEKGICFRKYGQLIFPTEFPKEKPPVVGEFDDPVTVRFDFSGAVRNLYAAVVSRLHYVGRFGQVSLWRNWGQFERDGAVCALELREPTEGQSHFTVSFNKACSPDRKKDFVEFVSDFLVAEGAEPRFGYVLRCHCGAVYPESIIDIALSRGEVRFRCGACGAEHDLRKTSSPQERGAQRDEGGKTHSVIAAPVTAPTEETHNALGILHLSDLHFKTGDSIDAVLGPLREDLLNFRHAPLAFIIISGDLTDRGEAAGFELAAGFIRRLHEITGVPLGRFIVCPGNHDVQDVDSIFALKSKPDDGEDIVDKFADDAYRVRVASEYPRRFDKFCLKYNELFDYDLRTGLPQLSREQLFPEQGLQFVTLNTAFRIDKYRRKESTIDPTAFARTLEQADKTVSALKLAKPVLRIAVWHHAVLGRWSMVDASPFVQRLAQGQYSVVLHGDVHEPRAHIADPFHSALYIAGAGSLHADDEVRPAGTGNLYNFLEFDSNFEWIKIHVREQRTHNGVFQGCFEYSEAGKQVDYFTIKNPPLYPKRLE